MTKISFDVDFSKDPEQILKEIQERAKAEVEKRESKERNAAYLSKLHESVNEKIGTDFNTVSDLIRALTPFAAPALRDKLSGTTASGRRKTISMNKTIFEEIKKLLTESDPNKAAIARKTGVSVVQVRKVAEGGFDSKYIDSDSSSGSSSKPKESPSLPSIAPPPIIEEEKIEQTDLKEMAPPPAASLNDDDNFSDSDDDSDINLKEDKPTPSLPSFGDDEPALPPPAPLAPLDIAPPLPVEESQETDESDADLLPPLPKFTPAPFESDEEEAESLVGEATPPLPSFGSEEPSLPPPAPLDIAPPSPDISSPAPIFEEPKESDVPEAPIPPTPEDIPSAPPSPPTMVTKSSTGGLTRPPSGLKPTLKPKLSTGKKGKPTLSLKPKSKSPGLKITRPPMRGTPPPSQ